MQFELSSWWHHDTDGRRAVQACSGGIDSGALPMPLRCRCHCLLLPHCRYVGVVWEIQPFERVFVARAGICGKHSHIYWYACQLTTTLHTHTCKHIYACLLVCWHNKVTKVQLLPVLYFFNLNSSRKMLAKSRQKSTSGQQQQRWTSDNNSNCNANIKKNTNCALMLWYGIQSVCRFAAFEEYLHLQCDRKVFVRNENIVTNF